jgi:hypothetical protein
MSRKVIGIIIIILGFFSLAGIVYFLFLNNLFPSWLNFGSKEIVPVVSEIPIQNDILETPADTESKEIKKITAEIPQNSQTEENTVDSAALKSDFEKDDLIRMSASFSERFGSYSNQSNFSNVIDLKIFMTDKMRKWADEYVKGQRVATTDSSIYFGVTTKAIKEDMKKYDDETGYAEVLVATRRQEARSTRANVSNAFSQNILITFKKENGSWKVDSAFWSEG